jgi:acyl carrier protein
MTRAEIFEVLKASLFEIVEGARGKEISEELSMKDYSADSLEMVEVVSRSMKTLKVKIPRTSLSTAKNLKELLDLFEQAVQARAAGVPAVAPAGAPPAPAPEPAPK